MLAANKPEQLQPCPFCGAKTHEKFVMCFGREDYSVLCWKCESYGPRKVSRKKAIAAWNRRHTDAGNT